MRTRAVAGLSVAAVAGLVGVTAAGASPDVARFAPQVEAAVQLTSSLLAAGEQAPADVEAAAPASPAEAPAPPRQVFDSVPADSVPGLTTTRAGRAEPAPATASGMKAGVGVRATAASRARMGAEMRASRAAARAMAGARAGFARPVHGTHQTSGFGPRWGRIHQGIDYAGPVGLPIRSVAAGKVTTAEVQRGYGNVVEVQHADGSFTRYGHLDKIRVKPGEEVEPAHIIGALGNTGRSTGPHLHFEVRTPAGTPVNPAPWLRDRGIVPLEVRPAEGR